MRYAEATQALEQAIERGEMPKVIGALIRDEPLVIHRELRALLEREAEPTPERWIAWLRVHIEQLVERAGVVVLRRTDAEKTYRAKRDAPPRAWDETCYQLRTACAFRTAAPYILHDMDFNTFAQMLWEFALEEHSRRFVAGQTRRKLPNWRDLLALADSRAFAQRFQGAAERHADAWWKIKPALRDDPRASGGSLYHLVPQA